MSSVRAVTVRDCVIGGGNYVAAARRCDKQLNSKTYTDQDYDRPDQFS